MKQDLVLLIISGQSKHHQSRESIWKKKTELCLGPFGNSCQEILVEQVPVKYVMTSSSGEFSAQFSVVESVVPDSSRRNSCGRGLSCPWESTNFSFAFTSGFSFDDVYILEAACQCSCANWCHRSFDIWKCLRNSSRPLNDLTDL